MAPAADPFTAASATYIAAQRSANRRSDALEVTQGGRVLTQGAQTIVVMALLLGVAFAVLAVLS